MALEGDVHFTDHLTRQTIDCDPQVTPLASKEVTVRLVNSFSNQQKHTALAQQVNGF